MLRRDVESLHHLISRQVVDCEKCPSLAGIGVMQVGITHAGEGWHLARVSCDHAFISVTLSGKGEVAVNDAWKKATPERAYLMPRRVFHGYRVAAGSEWCYVWVQLADFKRYPNLTALTEPAMVRAASYSVLAAVRGMIEESGRANHPQLMALWTELLYHSVLQLVFPKERDDRLEQVWQEVGQRLDKSWDIEELARSAGLSREQFRRRCWQQCGCSPHKKLTSMRLRRACEMLALDNLKLEAIGQALGYSDAFAFSQAFKREMGVSPKTYREKTRQARLFGRSDMI